MSITVNELGFSYGKHRVLENVSFIAENGAITAVLGANGAGKTTLFRCILGFLNGYEGKILVDGEDAKTMSAKQLAQRIAYIPQSHGGSFAYSVLDMVLMGTTHRLSTLSVPGKKERGIAEEALERIGIAQLADKDFNRISGGEQQLVLIARALAQKANTLLMDEPTSALDYGNRIRVLGTLHDLAWDGYSVVLSTHDPQHALRYADSVLALADGNVAASGPSKTVLTPDLIGRLYGVSAELIETASGPVIVPAGIRSRDRRAD